MVIEPLIDRRALNGTHTSNRGACSCCVYASIFFVSLLLLLYHSSIIIPQKYSLAMREYFDIKSGQSLADDISSTCSICNGSSYDCTESETTYEHISRTCSW